MLEYRGSFSIGPISEYYHYCVNDLSARHIKQSRREIIPCLDMIDTDWILLETYAGRSYTQLCRRHPCLVQPCSSRYTFVRAFTDNKPHKTTRWGNTNSTTPDTLTDSQSVCHEVIAFLSLALGQTEPESNATYPRYWAVTLIHLLLVYIQNLDDCIN